MNVNLIKIFMGMTYLWEVSEPCNIFNKCSFSINFVSLSNNHKTFTN